MFKKEGIDYIDIPELSRKKLINLPQTEDKDETKVTRDGFFDLSQEATNIIHPQKEQTQETQNSQVSDFMNDFSHFNSNYQTISQNNETKTENSDELKNLKWRLENLEFKLDQLIEKVNLINN